MMRDICFVVHDDTTDAHADADFDDYQDPEAPNEDDYEVARRVGWLGEG